jgi:hypothetical protein
VFEQHPSENEAEEEKSFIQPESPHQLKLPIKRFR